MEATLEIDAQYRALREEAGLLDRSDRARIVVGGAEAAEFLQGQLTNDVEALEPGGGCYAALLDRKGKIRADMRVLCLDADEFLIDTEPETADVLIGHLGTYNVGRDATVETDEEGKALLSLIGPLSAKLLGDVPLVPEGAHREVFVAGVGCRAIATDLGADLLVPAGAEAMLLSGAGAVAGILGGIVLMQIESRLWPGFQLAPSAAWAAGVVALALVVGAVFGLLPARRAARLEAVDALRAGR